MATSWAGMETKKMMMMVVTDFGAKVLHKYNLNHLSPHSDLILYSFGGVWEFLTEIKSLTAHFLS